jgi:glycosyltransferase involved in cell wall biosynthesis
MNNTDKKLPRVAMYIWQFPPIISGAEQQCKRLSQELIKKGMDVFIVTERLKNTKPFEIVSGIPVYRVGSLIWLRNFPAYIKDFFYFNKRDRRCYTHLLKNKDKFTILNKISEILTYKIPNYYFFITSFLLLHKKRKDFDIIHVHEAHWIASFGVWIARLLNKRVVVKETNSGDAMTFNKQSLKSQKKAMQADLFIAVSNKISTDLVSLGIAQQRIKKIPNGINIYDNKWQFNHIKERSVICISKLNQLPNKGIDILLKSWAILIQKYNKKVKLQYLAGESLIRSISRSSILALRIMWIFQVLQRMSQIAY